MVAMSRAFGSMVGGAVVAQLLSSAMMLVLSAPESRAAWSWQCTYYDASGSGTPKYMDVGATNGPKCSNGKKLSCGCTGKPCAGTNYSRVSDAACAGAGDDKANKGCFKLHHAYGKIQPLRAVLGWNESADACGAPEILKVYGNNGGLDLLISWKAIKSSHKDNSTSPTSAKACQDLCAKHTGCEFFTYNDGGASGGKYAYFRNLCFLQKALTCSGTKYVVHQSAISGPAKCATSTQASGAAQQSTQLALLTATLLATASGYM
eukprot:TRINITY_DN667_c0_g1_i1.p1 TRINITY_DN667_c0_g1~~TRINITY_DN667_c0_g1_i1.p1  ORF type:complete len:263 (-),score=48.85 TRINITY_DN667_c0_g1_i1:330-1118(-)